MGLVHFKLYYVVACTNIYHCIIHLVQFLATAGTFSEKSQNK